MGRIANTVHPDGTSVLNVYSLRGELLRTTGSRTYPVGYAYDAQGRMKHTTVWLSGSNCVAFGVRSQKSNWLDELTASG